MVWSVRFRYSWFMDFELVAREFLLALRGTRSQVAWSRRLGYRSNVAYAWESGRRQPTASEALRAAQRNHIDLVASFRAFYGATEPTWLGAIDDHASPEAVAAFLDEMRGSLSVTDLARHASRSRTRVSRWLSGGTQPRLPDFFRMIEATSLRLVDFISSFVSPEQVPSILPLYRRLEARRRGAFEVPWTQAVLRAIELDEYRALGRHQPGWIAARLGITEEEEQRCIDHLLLVGQLKQDAGGFVQDALVVDTRVNPAVSRHLKGHWAEVGLQRLRAGAPGQFSYNVFTVSAADFEQIRQLHLAYYHELRAIVAESEPGEHVAVANIQLFALDD
jgi:transcriptional regulator with XRE-family HTH domain